MGIIKRIRDRLHVRFGDHDKEFHSIPLRERFRKQGLDVGLYSYGCFDLSRYPAGVTIGRYSSFSTSSRVFLRNHGLTFLGLSPFFYNHRRGLIAEDTIHPVTMTFGDDVWVGHNAVMLPGVGHIGRGAAIAAGAVVTKPVPPYAVVAGNPARVIKMRFDEQTIAKIEATRWWELSFDQLKALVMEHPDLIFRPSDFLAMHPNFLPSDLVPR